MKYQVDLRMSRIPYRWVVLGIMLVVQIGTSLAFQALSALAPFVIADLGLSRGEMGLLVSIVQTGFLLAMFASGLMVDRHGERLVMTVGTMIAAVGGLALLAPSPVLLPAALFLLGFGTATIGPSGSKAIMVWFPARSRGGAMGIRMMATPLGGALAAALLPALALMWGWVAALVTVGAVCAILSLFVYSLYRDGPRDTAQTSHLPQAGLRLFRLRPLLLASTWSLTLIAGQFVLTTYLVLFFREDIGLPLESALPLLLIAQIAAAAARVALGWISDRVLDGKRKNGIVLASLLGIFVTICFATLPASILAPLAPFASVLAGFSLVGWHALMLTMVVELVPAREAASASGIYLTVNQLGAVFGPAAFGLVIDSVGTYRSAWLLLAILLCIGLAIGSRIPAKGPVNL